MCEWTPPWETRPEQVDALAPLEGAAQRLVLEERAVLDRLVDALQVLEEDAGRSRS